MSSMSSRGPYILSKTGDSSIIFKMLKATFKLIIFLKIQKILNFNSQFEHFFKIYFMMIKIDFWNGEEWNETGR